MTRQELAQQMATQAGKFLLKNFKEHHTIENTYKAHREVVTKYDQQSEQEIIKQIKQYFPEDDILAEESGADNQSGEYLWVVDPLDGTTNFVMHNPIFSVSIGIFKLNGEDKSKAEAVGAAIYWPMMDYLFTAQKDEPAQLNGKSIQVSEVSELANSKLTFCHGSSTEDKKRSAAYLTQLKEKNIVGRQLGSAAIELCLVASGYIESIAIPGAHAWDVAAGVLIVRSAGGKVTDSQGEEWNLDSQDMLASNSVIHDDILKLFNHAT